MQTGKEQWRENFKYARRGYLRTVLPQVDLILDTFMHQVFRQKDFFLLLRWAFVVGREASVVGREEGKREEGKREKEERERQKREW